jgi:hypothetical protein
MQKELLKIDLQEKYAVVNIDYVFENESDKNVSVKLAFPSVLVSSEVEEPEFTDVTNYEIREGTKTLDLFVTGSTKPHRFTLGEPGKASVLVPEQKFI